LNKHLLTPLLSGNTSRSPIPWCECTMHFGFPVLPCNITKFCLLLYCANKNSNI